jgi:hypothetical protein
MKISHSSCRLFLLDFGIQTLAQKYIKLDINFSVVKSKKYCVSKFSRYVTRNTCTDALSITTICSSISIICRSWASMELLGTLHQTISENKGQL